MDPVLLFFWAIALCGSNALKSAEDSLQDDAPQARQLGLGFGGLGGYGGGYGLGLGGLYGGLGSRFGMGYGGIGLGYGSGYGGAGLGYGLNGYRYGLGYGGLGYRYANAYGGNGLRYGLNGLRYANTYGTGGLGFGLNGLRYANAYGGLGNLYGRGYGGLGYVYGSRYGYGLGGLYGGLGGMYGGYGGLRRGGLFFDEDQSTPGAVHVHRLGEKNDPKTDWTVRQKDDKITELEIPGESIETIVLRIKKPEDQVGSETPQMQMQMIRADVTDRYNNREAAESKLNNGPIEEPWLVVKPVSHEAFEQYKHHGKKSTKEISVNQDNSE